jgi:hypothetical protein
MVYARLKFTLSGQPRVALLTDRGWTLLHGTAGQNELLNHICPLPVFDKDDGPEWKVTAAAAVAHRAIELLGGTIEP